jgi:hypothetical protein
MNRRSHRAVFAIAVSVSSVGMLLGSVLLSGVEASATGSAVTNCSPPTFPPGTPAPTTVTGPDQPPSSSLPVTAISSGGAIETLTPVCQWRVSFSAPGGDPTVTYNQYGNTQLNLGTQYGVDFSNNTGVSCDITVETVNFGGGAAQEGLTGSYCNTDGYVPGEGTVQGELVNGTVGPDETVATFNQVVTSFASGANIYDGDFQACSENPVGSHTNYACDYFYGGPTL